MKQRIYIETTVVSYLTSRLSRDIVLASHQQQTRQWWDEQRFKFDLYVSDLVIQEAREGDSEASKRRLDILTDLSKLSVEKESLELAKALLRGPIPQSAELDAFHIAIAATNGMDFLLTWNCKHIANPMLRRDIMEITRQMGYESPIICSPGDFLGD